MPELTKGMRTTEEMSVCPCGESMHRIERGEGIHLFSIHLSLLGLTTFLRYP